MIFYILLLAILVVCNMMTIMTANSLQKDLKDYEAIIESTMENNNKLIQINENVMTANKELGDRVDKWGALCTQQNDLCESVLKDNMEITAKVNQLLMQMDDGK